MSANPLVSVMIPVYNREEYVGSAIESVLAQTYSNFELIVHDDASTDGSWQVISRYRDPRLRSVRTRSNHGMLGGWNYLFRFGKGKYFKQMGSDDLLEPDCLARQVEALEANPNAALVTCRRDVIDSSGAHLRYFAFAGSDRTVNGAGHAHWILTNIRENKIGEPAAVMFPAKLLKVAGQFDPTFSQFADFEMWIRLLAHGDLIYLHDPLVKFRRHAGSHTSAAQLDGRFISEIFRLIEKYYGDPFYRRAFDLSDSDKEKVTRQKTLDSLKNIKDLLIAGEFSRARAFYRRLKREVSLGYMMGGALWKWERSRELAARSGRN